MKRVKGWLGISFIIAACFLMACPVRAWAADISGSFELRYVTDDVRADGETDFKGATAVFDTGERVEFLARYADYAKRWFGDPDLDRVLVPDSEVGDVLRTFKAQPLPEVRTRMRLDGWRWLAYREGQHDESIERIAQWNSIPWIGVSGGKLVISGDSVETTRNITPQTWRFSFTVTANLPAQGTGGSFALGKGKDAPAVIVSFDGRGGLTCGSGGRSMPLDSYGDGERCEIKYEVDLTEGRYNVYVNGELRADFVPLANTADSVDTFLIDGARGEIIESMLGIGYFPNADETKPYRPETFLDETFAAKPRIDGWNTAVYRDSEWAVTDLPHAHGSERYAGEDLYFRKTVRIGDFRRATLEVEALDPEGEIWINGRIAAVVPNRHPVRVDIGKYLIPNADNLIAVKVRHFNFIEYGFTSMGHSSLDPNIGWFAGRMALDLTAPSYIDDVFAYATGTGDPAKLRVRAAVTNEAVLSLRGMLRFEVSPWFPGEGAVAATADMPVIVGSGRKEFETDITVPAPKLWTSDSPNLYKVRAVLVEDGVEIDDYVVTTGIRTVGQEGGTFRVNGKPDMLNGAQIFGYRPPIENLVTWNRSCPIEWLVREILMIRKMNGNLMRVHVHAFQSPALGINDPRLAELCDQLGLMLIWSTSGWIRTAPGWNQIDFAGYPKYMRQVCNHPSIVMWEASNHPNSFRKRDYEESNIFCDTVYDTIYPVDPSRIISFTSFIRHLHYWNDAGTVDDKGAPIKPSRSWTAKNVTRGNQDSVTGYGKEWSELRAWPPDYYKDFLASKERAYFNFEHEESIGQDNWNLVKGKPWYLLQSYEWKYDEGSIGRKLTADEWEISQAWQAFSAYESMKKQRLLDYDGFSWCCLHGGPNSATYKKPLIDYLGHPKLAWYANKVIFQRVVAGSDDVDVVYGPGDEIRPVVMNLGDARTVVVVVEVKTLEGRTVAEKTYAAVKLPSGRTVTRLPAFKPSWPAKGYYAIEYRVR